MLVLNFSNGINLHSVNGAKLLCKHDIQNSSLIFIDLTQIRANDDEIREA